jgi:hypothetical protein
MTDFWGLKLVPDEHHTGKWTRFVPPGTHFVLHVTQATLGEADMVKYGRGPQRDNVYIVKCRRGEGAEQFVLCKLERLYSSPATVDCRKLDLRFSGPVEFRVDAFGGSTPLEVHLCGFLAPDPN